MSPDEMDTYELKDYLNSLGQCQVFKDHRYRDSSTARCKIHCQPQIDTAKTEGRTTNYGCVSFQQGSKSFTWDKDRTLGEYAMGKCVCDNFLVNEIADTIIDALPAIAQVSCSRHLDP